MRGVAVFPDQIFYPMEPGWERVMTIGDFTQMSILKGRLGLLEAARIGDGTNVIGIEDVDPRKMNAGAWEQLGEMYQVPLRKPTLTGPGREAVRQWLLGLGKGPGKNVHLTDEALKFLERAGTDPQVVQFAQAVSSLVAKVQDGIFGEEDAAQFLIDVGATNATRDSLPLQVQAAVHRFMTEHLLPADSMIKVEGGMAWELLMACDNPAVDGAPPPMVPVIRARVDRQVQEAFAAAQKAQIAQLDFTAGATLNPTQGQPVSIDVVPSAGAMEEGARLVIWDAGGTKLTEGTVDVATTSRFRFANITFPSTPSVNYTVRYYPKGTSPAEIVPSRGREVLQIVPQAPAPTLVFPPTPLLYPSLDMTQPLPAPLLPPPVMTGPFPEGSFWVIRYEDGRVFWSGRTADPILPQGFDWTIVNMPAGQNSVGLSVYYEVPAGGSVDSGSRTVSPGAKKIILLMITRPVATLKFDTDHPATFNVVEGEFISGNRSITPTQGTIPEGAQWVFRDEGGKMVSIRPATGPVLREGDNFSDLPTGEGPVRYSIYYLPPEVQVNEGAVQGEKGEVKVGLIEIARRSVVPAVVQAPPPAAATPSGPPEFAQQPTSVRHTLWSEGLRRIYVTATEGTMEIGGKLVLFYNDLTPDPSIWVEKGALDVTGGPIMELEYDRGVFSSPGQYAIHYYGPGEAVDPSKGVIASSLQVEAEPPSPQFSGMNVRDYRAGHVLIHGMAVIPTEGVMEAGARIVVWYQGVGDSSWRPLDNFVVTDPRPLVLEGHAFEEGQYSIRYYPKGTPDADVTPNLGILVQRVTVPSPS